MRTTIGNLAQMKFGRLLVLGETVPVRKPDKSVKRGWSWYRRVRARCDCGEVRSVRPAQLVNGNTSSCGCLTKERVAETHRSHGHCTNGSPSPEYMTWNNMKDRCSNSNAQYFRCYGGRGITVCSRWLNSFETFLADMGERPEGSYSLDRLDNNGPYCRCNCDWRTLKEQARNRGHGETWACTCEN